MSYIRHRAVTVREERCMRREGHNLFARSVKRFFIFAVCSFLMTGCTSANDKSQETAAQVEENVSEAEAVGKISTDVSKADVTEAETEVGPETSADTQEQETVPREPLEKYTELLKINPYIAGWLKIDDSVIDNPVVYTPGSQNYFLHRAIDGSEESRGTLFIAINWQEGYNNTLIYGHNMKDGTAFGSLAKFADESYGKSHNIIHFDTLYEEREYELYAAFYSQIAEEDLETDEDRAEADQAIEEGEIDLFYDFGDYDIFRQEKDEDAGRFRYYYYTDLADRADFEYFAENVKKRALYDTGVEAEWGDEFVTLSTCSYHVYNGRFVVVGIRKH